MVMTLFYAAVRAHKTREVRKQAEQKISVKEGQLEKYSQDYHSFISNNTRLFT